MSPKPLNNTPIALLNFPELPGLAPALSGAFYQPQQWLIATHLQDVPRVLARAHELSTLGAWVLGWVAYEAAGAFDPVMTHVTHQADHATPLAAMAVFEHREPWVATTGLDYLAQAWTNPLSRERFDALVAQIHEWIAAGEVYQINLTTRLCTYLEGQALDYFHALWRAQPNSHALYLRGMQADILSVSPELFFHWDGSTITTQPMKGTAPRGMDEVQDLQLAQALRESAKERAENLMIVDLLRNDLSRIARPGTVQVPDLFGLQALPTVWQMSSRVQASTREGVSLVDIFKALFPCGSITGAPKIQAMRRIADLETTPRGVYCGAVGVMQPGGNCRFSVPIRTVVIERHCSLTPGRLTAQCGVGSAVTSDAQAASEWQEWRHKQGFLERAAAPFELLESILLDEGRMPLLERHLQRMSAAAEHFQYKFDEALAREQLLGLALSQARGRYKLRLRCALDGRLTLECASATAWPSPLKVDLATQPIDSSSEFVRFKTTQRSIYKPFAPTGSSMDTLLWNHAGQLTEFTMGNVALRMSGRWLTPSLDAGLLAGTYRAQLLDEGRISTACLPLELLLQAEGYAFINSVRGWVELDGAHLRGAALALAEQRARHA